jgi:hypothetical protein
MRSYASGYANHKPPSADAPLFLDRDTGLDTDADSNPDIPLDIRKRKTTIEKYLEQGLVQPPAG